MAMKPIPLASPLLRALLAALLLAGGFASAQPASPRQERSSSAERASLQFAPPVPWFTFTLLRDFEPQAGNQVVVWPDRAGRAWLLTLAPPCAGLADARLLGITAAGRRVVSGVDEVVVDGRRCRIQRLERLDAEQRAALVPATRTARVVAVRPRPPGESRPVRPRGGP